MQTLIADKFDQVSVDSRNVGFFQTWEMILKQVCPKQKRNVTPLLSVDLNFE